MVIPQGGAAATPSRKAEWSCSSCDLALRSEPDLLRHNAGKAHKAKQREEQKAADAVVSSAALHDRVRGLLGLLLQGHLVEQTYQDMVAFYLKFKEPMRDRHELWLREPRYLRSAAVAARGRIMSRCKDAVVRRALLVEQIQEGLRPYAFSVTRAFACALADSVPSQAVSICLQGPAGPLSDLFDVWSRYVSVPTPRAGASASSGVRGRRRSHPGPSPACCHVLDSAGTSPPSVRALLSLPALMPSTNVGGMRSGADGVAVVSPESLSMSSAEQGPFKFGELAQMLKKAESEAIADDWGTFSDGLSDQDDYDCDY